MSEGQVLTVQMNYDDFLKLKSGEVKCYLQIPIKVTTHFPIVDMDSFSNDLKKIITNNIKISNIESIKGIDHEEKYNELLEKVFNLLGVVEDLEAQNLLCAKEYRHLIEALDLIQEYVDESEDESSETEEETEESENEIDIDSHNCVDCIVDMSNPNEEESTMDIGKFITKRINEGRIDHKEETKDETKDEPEDEPEKEDEKFVNYHAEIIRLATPILNHSFYEKTNNNGNIYDSYVWLHLTICRNILGIYSKTVSVDEVNLEYANFMKGSLWHVKTLCDKFNEILKEIEDKQISSIEQEVKNKLNKKSDIGDDELGCFYHGPNATCGKICR